MGKNQGQNQDEVAGIYPQRDNNTSVENGSSASSISDEETSHYNNKDADNGKTTSENDLIVNYVNEIEELRSEISKLKVSSSVYASVYANGAEGFSRFAKLTANPYASAVSYTQQQGLLEHVLSLKDDDGGVTAGAALAVYYVILNAAITLSLISQDQLDYRQLLRFTSLSNIDKSKCEKLRFLLGRALLDASFLPEEYGNVLDVDSIPSSPYTKFLSLTKDDEFINLPRKRLIGGLEHKYLPVGCDVINLDDQTFRVLKCIGSVIVDDLLSDQTLARIDSGAQHAGGVVFKGKSLQQLVDIASTSPVYHICWQVLASANTSVDDSLRQISSEVASVESLTVDVISFMLNKCWLLHLVPSGKAMLGISTTNGQTDGANALTLQLVMEVSNNSKSTPDIALQLTKSEADRFVMPARFISHRLIKSTAAISLNVEKARNGSYYFNPEAPLLTSSSDLSEYFLPTDTLSGYRYEVLPAISAGTGGFITQNVKLSRDKTKLLIGNYGIALDSWRAGMSLLSYIQSSYGIRDANGMTISNGIAVTNEVIFTAPHNFYWKSGILQNEKLRAINGEFVSSVRTRAQKLDISLGENELEVCFTLELLKTKRTDLPSIGLIIGYTEWYENDANNALVMIRKNDKKRVCAVLPDSGGYDAMRLYNTSVPPNLSHLGN